MSDVFQTESKNIQKITEEYVKELIKMWSQMFDEDSCRDNLRKLGEHAVDFYKEILTESKEKKNNMEKEIENLYNEAENHQRLLKVNVKLPQASSSKPLLILQFEIDKSLVDLRERLRKRKEKIYKLQLEQETLCNELDEPMRSLPENTLPNEKQIKDFQFYLESLKYERAKRIENIADLKRDIKSFEKFLGLNEPLHDLLPQSHHKLSRGTLTDLQQIHKCYKVQVDILRDEIIRILNISPAIKNSIKKCNDYTYITYGMIYAELQSCEVWKRENLGRFVNQLRQEIIFWWDKLLKSEIERSHFSNFYSSCYTDDLLEIYVLELENLKQFYETNYEIYELFAERKMLWQRMCALEEKTSSPGHYYNQLLKEEKERKTIATKLPKIEQQLTKLVKAYIEREQKPFYVYGVDILEYMSNEWERKRIHKEKLRSARKNAQTSLPKTIKTPMSLKKTSSVSASSINYRVANVISQARKLNASNKKVPMPNRELYKAYNNASLLLKSKSGSCAKNMDLKSPHTKMHRVVSKTISRNFVRQSGNLKKRLSTHKNVNKKLLAVDITECSDSTEESYHIFEKCIETTSRSTFINPAALPNHS